MKTKYLKINENTSVNVREDTQFVLDVDGIIKFEDTDNICFELIFDKSGVQAEIIVLYKLKNLEHLSFSTVSTHKAVNTSCETFIKGCVSDSAVSKYEGKIIIEKKASQTIAYLHDNVLMFGDLSRHHSKPILEISNNDVKASHGATSGRVNPEQLYYLQSRGLSKTESEAIVLEGFFDSVLSRIIDPEIKETLSLGVKYK